MMAKNKGENIMGLKSFFTNLFKKKQKSEVQVSKTKPKEQKVQITESQQKYYDDLQKGYRFLQFIYDDIERMKKQHVNRAMRRRFEQKLSKGRFSREMVDEYGKKIVEINQFIKEQDIISDKQAEENKKKAEKEAQKQREAEIKKQKKQKDKAVDGKEYYENAKKEENKK
jgi:hypothetical protein